MNIDPTAASESSLSIESIKELMDGFDPASLLPELSSVFDKVLLACRIAVMAGPIILLILGLAYLLVAPKEANYYFGYRCYYGMGSVQAWRFTQRIAGVLLGVLGLVLTIVMFISSRGFAGMEMMDMVWRALRCVIWEAVLVVLATVAINVIAMVSFDRKGELRRKKQAE